MMKIMFVVSSLAGGFPATVGKIVEQTGDDFEYSIVSLTPNGVAQFESHFGNHVRSFYVLKKKRKLDVDTYLRLYKILKQNKPDVVKSFDFATNTNIWWISAVEGIPWVARVAGIETYFYRWHALIGRIAFQHARNIVVASNAVKQKILKHRMAPARKVLVIPNAISTPPQYRNPELPSPDGKVYLGYVAGFYSEFKGHRYAIEAIQHLPERYHLILIGDGRLRSEMQDLARDLGLENRVRFLGQLDRDEVMRQLLSMHALVFPSFGEAFGWGIVEAMSVGLPVIASDAEGINEIVKDGINGYLVPTRNPQAIAKTVLSLLSDQTTYNLLCENTRKTVETHFSNERLRQDYVKLFNGIVKS